MKGYLKKLLVFLTTFLVINISAVQANETELLNITSDADPEVTSNTYLEEATETEETPSVEVTYTITYELNGGKNNISNPATYVDTSSITLANPSRTGYTFNGWYMDADYQNIVTEIPKGSKGDKILYAKWSVNKYNIHFDGNGATRGKMSDMTSLEYDTTFSLAANGFARTGYKFVGWNTKADGTGTMYKNQESVKNLIHRNRTVTLYAIWKRTHYAIDYYLNGGRFVGEIPNTYTITTLVTLPIPTRTGYTFNGWYTDDTYKTKVESIPVGSTGARAYYAKWTVNKYNVHFDGNGATRGKMSDMLSLEYGTTFSLAANGFARTGYKFLGWNTKADGTGTMYKNQESVKNLIHRNRTVTLYAIWKRTLYTINYNLNGGTNSVSNPSTYTVITPTITLAEPTKRGYTFNGWYTDNNYKTKITSIPKRSSGNITLYAKWSVNNYGIVYHLNGGTNHVSNPSAYTIRTNTIQLQEPTRKGYTFDGWYSDTSYQNVVTEIPKGSRGRVTIYAKWIANQYNVTFDGNGATSGSMSNMTDLTYDTSYTLSRNAYKKDGWSFVGWNTKADGTGTRFLDRSSIENLTKFNGRTFVLYAEWGVKTPSISLIEKQNYRSSKITYRLVENADGYEIYRSQSKYSGYQLIATKTQGYYYGEKPTDYIFDNEVEAATKYYYKLRAYKLDENGKKIYSDYTYPLAHTAAAKPNFDGVAISRQGTYSRHVSLYINNYGRKPIIIADLAHVYPYKNASYTKADLIDESGYNTISTTEIASKGSKAVYFRLEYERFFTKGTHIAFIFQYDGCVYAAVVYDDGYWAYESI